ncbi:MAG: hypothetical protein V4616_02550 [Bacteroidota bacterium]
MKKVFTAGLLLAAATATYAQSAKVVSAYNYNQKGELDKAWQTIEEATQDPKTGIDAKTWKYRMDILTSLQQNLMDPKGKLEYKSIVKPEDLADKMKESYQKVKEYDTKKKFITDIDNQVKITAAVMNNQATEAYNGAADLDKFKQDNLKGFGLIIEDNKTNAEGITKNLEALKSRSEKFKTKVEINKCLDGDKAEVANCIDKKMKERYLMAFAGFAQSVTVYDVIGVVDSANLFNAAICAEKAGMKKEAAALYAEAANINYGGSQVYALSSRIYSELGDKEKQLNIIKQGRKAYPEDAGLLTDELNIYLLSQNYIESEKLLKQAVEKMPTNENLFYAMGVAYDNIANPRDKDGKDLAKPANYDELVIKSRDAYKRALELKPEYFDALYNYGALLFNEGVEFNNKANQLDYKKKAQIDEMNKKADAKFKEAIPVFEKARALNGEDQGVLQSLKQLYIRTEQTAKYDEVNAKLKSMK